MNEGGGNVEWASLVIFPQLGGVFREFVFRQVVHVVVTLVKLWVQATINT